jgi:BASS family bile acid:Na+ symporter
MIVKAPCQSDRGLSHLSTWFGANLFWLLVGSYAVAAWWPGPGQWLRSATVVCFSLGDTSFHIAMPMVMLAFLLFNAGTALTVRQLAGFFRAPWSLLITLAANLAIPVLYVIGMIWMMRIWHPPEIDEVQDLLAGLALVASVPIAGSSTAWSQNSDGDMPFSVGLLVLSTMLSPVTGPVALSCLAPLAVGGYADALARLAAIGGGLLLLGCVLAPLTIGLALRCLVGKRLLAPSQPGWKCANAVILLLLNYANASAILPRLLADPDWHFLGAAMFFASGLCLVLFVSAWMLGSILQFSRGRKVSLMFGLGMTNNGTGLVLASMAMGDYPRVVLPIILYNLIQHLVAGAVQSLLRRSEAVRRPLSIGGGRSAALPSSSNMPRTSTTRPVSIPHIAGASCAAGQENDHKD